MTSATGWDGWCLPLLFSRFHQQIDQFALLNDAHHGYSQGFQFPTNIFCPHRGRIIDIHDVELDFWLWCGKLLVFVIILQEVDKQRGRERRWNIVLASTMQWFEAHPRTASSSTAKNNTRAEKWQQASSSHMSHTMQLRRWHRPLRTFCTIRRWLRLDNRTRGCHCLSEDEWYDDDDVDGRWSQNQNPQVPANNSSPLIGLSTEE